MWVQEEFLSTTITRPSLAAVISHGSFIFFPKLWTNWPSVLYTSTTWSLTFSLLDCGTEHFVTVGDGHAFLKPNSFPQRKLVLQVTSISKFVYKIECEIPDESAIFHTSECFPPKTDFCVLPPSYGNLGPSFQVSLLLGVAVPMPPSLIFKSFPDWLKKSAILDFENNSIHCSLNNSLLSFSAPDWLPPPWALYTTSNHRKSLEIGFDITRV